MRAGHRVGPAQGPGVVAAPGEAANARASDVVRENLSRLASTLVGEGLARPSLDGKMLRPLAAYLTVPVHRREELDDRFWWGVLAVEMVHEASLLHDDILDEAPERRGRPTLSSTAGIGAALVLGDHLLTSAYRAAANAGSPKFLGTFIQAVERTVAGEIAQERAQGRILDEWEYRRNITEKSGELFRAALSLSPSLLGVGSTSAVGEIGARLGCLYQMVDDFLDYCPHAERGKPPLQDLRQRKWTWPLGLIGGGDFEASEEDTLDRLFRRAGSGSHSPMESGIVRVNDEVGGLLADLRAQGLESRGLAILLDQWVLLLRQATEAETVRRAFVSPERSALVTRARESLLADSAFLGTADARLAYFGRHAKTFRFAARLFPKDALDHVAGVYAFCRFTDDLVDEVRGVQGDALDALLDAWLALAREAYQGRPTGSPFLEEVLGSARRAEVPFHYAEALVEGIRMDIRPRSYRNVDGLRAYSYRVASVVGGWLTELFGIHHPWVLERAFALGHAMQLTNILRDVGEDLRNGRLYLPEETLAHHGVDRDLLHVHAKARGGAPMFPGYRRLLEELMARADADYAKAFQAIPALPDFFQGPVAIAARAYQGIHAEIRSNQYDNLTRRARTSTLGKLRLATRALLDLRLLKRRQSRDGGASAQTRSMGVEDPREAAA